MKRWLIVLLWAVLLSGCSRQDGNVDRAMDLRQELLQGSGCSFQAEVTADYGDRLYTFSMDCQGDSQGNMTFTVTAPETIAGITGQMSQSGGALTFDGTALAFEPLAEGQIGPVGAPWLLVHTLRGGYLVSGTEEDGLLRLAIDDSYGDDALHMDIWLDGENRPVRGEVQWDGRRILSITVENFTIS